MESLKYKASDTQKNVLYELSYNQGEFFSDAATSSAVYVLPFKGHKNKSSGDHIPGMTWVLLIFALIFGRREIRVKTRRWKMWIKKMNFEFLLYRRCDAPSANTVSARKHSSPL